MPNQFATATGYDVSGSTALAGASYVVLALLALFARRGPAIKAYVAARPRISAIVGMLEAIGFDGKKLRDEAAAALNRSPK